MHFIKKKKKKNSDEGKEKVEKLEAAFYKVCGKFSHKIDQVTVLMGYDCKPRQLLCKLIIVVRVGLADLQICNGFYDFYRYEFL